MISNHPLGVLGESFECADSGCDICTLGPLPGEDREQWMARLRERFRGQPDLFLPDDDAQHRAPPPRPVMVPCPACGKSKPLNGRCIGCVARGRAAAREPLARAAEQLGALPPPLTRARAIRVCPRCHGPKVDGRGCGICALNTKRIGRGAVAS